MNKVALFDFCETLTDFQTADAYVDYVRKHIGTARMKRIETIQQVLVKTKIIRAFEKLTCNKYSLNKHLKLYQLKGLLRDSLETMAKYYYEEEIKPHFIDEVLCILQERKKQGWEIVLVSGGYDIYLKYFAQEFGINKVISTRIKFNGLQCQGNFDGMDCLNENKVMLLNKIYGKCIFIESEAYSDSKNDLPFLNWADKGFVISKDTHQSWIDNYSYNEIIWTRSK